MYGVRRKACEYVRDEFWLSLSFLHEKLLHFSEEKKHAHTHNHNTAYNEKGKKMIKKKHINLKDICRINYKTITKLQTPFFSSFCRWDVSLRT